MHWLQARFEVLGVVRVAVAHSPAGRVQVLVDRLVCLCVGRLRMVLVHCFFDNHICWLWSRGGDSCKVLS